MVKYSSSMGLGILYQMLRLKRWDVMPFCMQLGTERIDNEIGERGVLPWCE